VIRFEEITNQNLWDVCRLKVKTEQEDFVARNIESIAEAYATRNEGYIAQPFAVYDCESLIGFIMFGKGTVGDENEPDWMKDSYCIWRLMVDERYQNKGYGKTIMRTALAYIRTFPLGEAELVWLSYEPENTAARKLYRRFGFRENGEMCGDEIIAVRKL